MQRRVVESEWKGELGEVRRCEKRGMRWTGDPMLPVREQEGFRKHHQILHDSCWLHLEEERTLKVDDECFGSFSSRQVVFSREFDSSQDDPIAASWNLDTLHVQVS